MLLVLVVGGLAALYLLSRPPAVQPAGQTAFRGFPQAIGTPQALNPNTTDQQITGGLTAAANHDPEPISRGILTLGAEIAGVFTQAHQAAMKREGATLNAATPTFIKELQYTFDALNQGAISEGQALDYLRQAQADYELTTQGVRHDNGQCVPGCAYDGRSYGATHCCSTGSSCNAACCIRCGLVVPAVENLSAIVKAGGGRYTIAPFPTNGYIQGTPAVSFSYLRMGAGSMLLHDLFSRLGL